MFDCSRFFRFPILPFFCACAVFGIAALRAASLRPEDVLDDSPILPGPETQSPLPNGGDNHLTNHSSSTYARKSANADPLMALVRHLPLLNDATVNPEAQYILCLYSASWCGPCRRELPKVVEFYLRKTDNGRHKGNMELILFDFDHSETAARAWIARERVPFPATYHAPSTLPGARDVGSIPTMIALDEKGQILLKGNPGAILASWDALAAGKVPPLALPDNNRHH